MNRRDYDGGQMLPSQFSLALFFVIVACFFLGLADAEALSIYACPVESSEVECAGEASMDDSEVTSVMAVFTCRGGTVGAGDGWSSCGDAGADGEWIFVSELLATDYVWYQTEGFQLAADAVFFQAGGEEPPATINLLGIPDLTIAQWGQITQAVMLMFVSIAVIRLIRQYFK